MTEARRIGVIGAAGWLGRAMACAAVERGVVAPERLTLSSRSDRHPSPPAGYWTKDNRELVARSDVVVVSVRPQDFAAIDIEAREKLVISVMAGVPAAVIARHTKAERVIRAMPNGAVSLGKSFTPWFSAGASEADRELAQRWLSACGEAEEVFTEDHLDYCAGLTGAGAAFPALLAQAMIAAARARGLDPGFARRAALAVIADASQLLRAPGADPGRVLQELIDYRGTTAAALASMTEDFERAVAAGLEAAARRGEEMSAAAAGALDTSER